VPLSRRAIASVPIGLSTSQLNALAEVVLPGALGVSGQQRAVREFLHWLADYRTGAQLDHGYGVTRLAYSGESPARLYPAQLAGLDRRAGGSFASLPLDERRRVVTEAITAADVAHLPERPDGGHVATDLMALFFNGPEANDLVYGRLIGRFGCRGLDGSETRPPPLDPAGDQG
jgi:hypothetical protein